MKDPRYSPNASRHPLPEGLFAGVELPVIDDVDGGYVESFYPGCGQTPKTDAEWFAAWKYDDKTWTVEWVDMSDLHAPQTYWCEQNVARLQQLRPDQREMPKVLRFEGKMILVDGTHRCLLSLMENNHRLIKVQVYEVSE
jgi:hypothetical protein